MGNKLELLLNILIQKGRKPFNVDCDWTDVEVINRLNDNRYIPEHSEIIFKTNTHRHVFDCNIRDLVSKSSGLWQFVCENGMVNVDETEVYYFWLKRKGTLDRGHYYLSEAGEDIRTNNFEYRLIEASLKDESELEDFLLQNIKVGNED